MQEPRTIVAVVDDEESIRKALRRLLRSAGFDVADYASGQELLDAVATRRPDCVVLDIRMPHMTGFDVQARLKSALVAAPIIFITGLDEPGDRKAAMASGAFAFLRKPFVNDDLLDCIARAVKAYRDATASVPAADCGVQPPT